ncbi:MAG: PDZ domain-containing protein, partial [Archangium sp.]|nr:PDZ domain-containing protein [Archangium sp.]
GRSATIGTEVTTAGAQVTLTLEASFNIVGKVTEKSTGLPVQGARIEAISGEFGKAFRVTVLSDGRGEFQLPPVPVSVMLRCEREGFIGRWMWARAGPPWNFELDAAPKDQGKRGSEVNQFEGVGMTLDGRSGNVLVTVVSEGSPAERGGMQVGDQLLQVDRVNVAGMNLNDVVNRIRGPAGTPVVITFIRQGQTLEVTLRRRLLTL